MIELRENQTFFMEALATPTRYPAQPPAGVAAESAFISGVQSGLLEIR